MKIPTTLVEIARVTKLDASGWEWTWNKRDNMLLFTDPKGRKLFLILDAELKNEKSAKRRMSQTSKRARTMYRRFTEFKADTCRNADLSDRRLKKTGTANYICYDSDKWTGNDQLYRHDFESPATIYCDKASKPTIMVISGQNVWVTRLGIEG
jgi:hypothetical protein